MNQKGFANIVFVVLVVVLAGAVGYFVWVKKPASVVPQAPTSTTTQTPVTQQPTPTTANSGSVYSKTYKNDEVGVEFGYPSDWQGFRVARESSDQSPTDYKGTGVSICSEPTCLFNLTAYTPNFTFMGMSEGGGLEYLGRTSDKQRLSCSYYEITQGCKTFEIQGRKAISVYVTFSIGGGLHATRRVVLVENPGQKFTGIVMQYALSSLDVQSVNSREANAAYTSDVKNKLTRNELTAEDRNGLEVFDKIVSTVTFIR